MSIYTKKGDKGETDLISLRVKKSDINIEVIGQIDNLMVLFSILIVELKEKQNDDMVNDLKTIYKKLFLIQTIICDTKDVYKMKITDEDIKFLETKIDFYSKQLPVLHNFIYYTGDKTSMYCHEVRTKVREVERIIIRLNDDREIDSFVLGYVNRLSDYLFTLARFINKTRGGEEDLIIF